MIRSLEDECTKVAAELRIMLEEWAPNFSGRPTGASIVRHAAMVIEVLGARRPAGTLTSFDSAAFLKERTSVGRDGLLAELVSLERENQRIRADNLALNAAATAAQARGTELLEEVRRAKTLLGHVEEFRFGGYTVRRLADTRADRDGWWAAHGCRDGQSHASDAFPSLGEALEWVRARGVVVP